MKAITIWQPWATLIAIGAKRYETRGWATDYRGPLAIHAASKKDVDCLALCRRDPFRSVLVAGGIERIGDLPFGAIVAVGSLMGCIDTKTLRKELEGSKLFPHEQDFGDFRDGRFGWQIGHVHQVDPVVCRGQQKLWDWSPPANLKYRVPA